MFRSELDTRALADVSMAWNSTGKVVSLVSCTRLTRLIWNCPLFFSWNRNFGTCSGPLGLGLALAGVELSC